MIGLNAEVGLILVLDFRPGRLEHGHSNVRVRALTINGNFGAVVLPFSNLAKMEEIHSAIVVLNRMGSPIVRMR